MATTETCMVERVARAMAKACRRDHDWPFWLDEARAAIRAMQDPTGEMVTAGSNAPIQMWDGSGGTFADDPTPIFAAMMAAALGEAP